jgi:hypothetical protein
MIQHHSFAVNGEAKAKEVRETTRKILSATRQVVDVLEGVAEVNPFAKVWKRPKKIT